MIIGRFKLEIQYDMQCDACGEYRSNIGYLTRLSTKPTSKILKLEGWTIISRELSDGTKIKLQLCPNCSRKNKNCV